MELSEVATILPTAIQTLQVLDALPTLLDTFLNQLNLQRKFPLIKMKIAPPPVLLSAWKQRFRQYLGQLAGKKEKGPPPGTPSPPSPFLKYVRLRHNAGIGDNSTIIFGTNYTTLDLFLAPTAQPGHFLPFLNVRGHRFDNDTYAANFGVGFRYIPDTGSFCELLGANVYYDYREGRLNTYSQIGVGLEILGKRWDVRGNAYIPVGAKKNKLTCVFDDYLGDFIIINKNFEMTTYAFNAEIGWTAVNSKYWMLYLAGGPYYLGRHSQCMDKPIFGGEFRIQPQYKDYFAVDFIVSHDDIYKTVFQCVATVILPLYKIKPLNRGVCLYDRQVYQPVERFEIMPIGGCSCWKFNY